jgi:YVTN family beta-propeller protein
MRRVLLTVVSALAPVVVAFAAATGYHILSEIQIGGEGGWDYLTVDSAARRLYVSHATHVVVVDLDSNKVVGDIPDTPGVHGIAIASELGKGFISNGRGNNVTIFDVKTLKASGTVPTGENPDDITYDKITSRVFAFNGRSTRRPARLPRRFRCRASRSSRLPTARGTCTTTSRTRTRSSKSTQPKRR